MTKLRPQNLPQELTNTFPSYPLILNIESVYGCPYNCIMCDVKEKRPLSMPIELLKKLETVYPHLKLLGIHGDGEPLLGEYIDYLIEICQKNNIILHMNTTGFYLENKIIESLLNGPRLSIGFSINAGTAKTYKKIMGNDFRKVKENIKYIIEKNNHLGFKDNEFFFSYIVMKENIDEISDFLYFAKEVGVNRVRFMRLLPKIKTLKGVFRKENNFKFYYFEQFNKKVRKRFMEKLPSIKMLAEKLGINIIPGDLEIEYNQRLNFFLKGFFRKLSPFKPKGFCLAPFIGGALIKYNGDIYLCCSLPYKIGNLYNARFERIWNSERMRNIRNIFLSGRLLNICGGCRTIRLEEYPNRLIFKNLEFNS